MRDLYALLMALKDPDDFRKEEEWRLLVVQTGVPDRFATKCCSDGRRYIELPICRPETVVEIVIGPHCELEVQSVSQVLKDAGLRGASVRKSTLVLPA